MENINIRIRNFKTKVGNLISESELPAFLIYEILNNFTLQINNALQEDMYQSALAKDEEVQADE